MSSGVRNITCFPEPVCQLGEGPVWSANERALHWIDCDGRAMFDMDIASGSVRRTDLPKAPGSYAMRARGGMIMAYRNQLALIAADGLTHEVVPTPCIDFALERFNDGRCDRRGRFWVGSMDKSLKAPAGGLFRVDADLSVQRVAGDIVLSNGIAMSPDDRTLYHTDSRAPVIYAYDFDIDAGAVSNRRVFSDFRHCCGRPDGCVMDAEGCLWVAEYDGGCVVRLDPAGRRMEEIAMPVSRPTCPVFGGDDLRTLYVTSMRLGLTEDALREQPHAGCLFAVEVGVPGLPETPFAG